MNEKELETISNAVTKLDLLCTLSIDPVDTISKSDIQTLLYTILDYVHEIKSITDKAKIKNKN